MSTQVLRQIVKDTEPAITSIDNAIDRLSQVERYMDCLGEDTSHYALMLKAEAALETAKIFTEMAADELKKRYGLDAG